MDILIGILVLLVVGGIVAYIKFPSVKAFVNDRLHKTGVNVSDAITGTATPTSPSQATPVPTPTQSAPKQPVNDGTRDTQVASTQAYMPKDPKPNTDSAGRPIEDVGHVDVTPQKLPETWDGKPFRIVMSMKAGEVYSISVYGKKGHVSITPRDVVGAKFQVTKHEADKDSVYGGLAPQKYVPFDFAGSGVLQLFADTDNLAWVAIQ